ncbi:hypothetical protein V9T40_000728 [Parthenolecanium corni]|uniref:phytanoyl-CoA dioxygenase n=1 Tax=Parthenolecanium corni TaxID=536013 RepID=A0AAN9TBN5_9HEMI
MKPVDRMTVVWRHLRQNVSLAFNETASTYSFEYPDFQYTLPNNLMTTEQRKFYDDNGYLLIKDLIPHSLLDLFRQHFIEICEKKIDVGIMTLMKDISLAKTNAQGEYLYNKVQDIAYDEVFSKYMFYPKLLDYVECFTGPNIKAMHSMLINKPPDAGTLSSRHPVHQDLHYFPFRPAKRIVASWTAMERVTVDNGCLFVLPGTHKGNLHPHTYPDWDGAVNKMYHGVQGFDNHPKVFVEMEKGDTVFFHPLLLHGSGPNLTKGFRKAISFHFAASECEYIDVKGTIQDNIRQEVEEIARRRGAELDFCTIWRAKSRLARGIEVNL